MKSEAAGGDTQFSQIHMSHDEIGHSKQTLLYVALCIGSSLQLLLSSRAAVHGVLLQRLLYLGQLLLGTFCIAFVEVLLYQACCTECGTVFLQKKQKDYAVRRD